MPQPIDIGIAGNDRKAVADEAHDEPTADLLTQRMRIHEKNAWMLRSMLQQH